MTLLGYEICGAKEQVNYFPVIIEKSIEENNGCRKQHHQNSICSYRLYYAYYAGTAYECRRDGYDAVEQNLAFENLPRAYRR